jgi:predicted dehydrogenase
MTRLNTAILGCGQFAHRHAQILTQLEDEINLVAFCDRNPERAESYATQYTAGKAAVFTDHHKMFDRQALDLLFICLPPFGHTDEVELAAQLGIHLLVEKPIALDSEQAWRMVAAAESAGIKTQVGFMFRFGEAVEELKNKIESGEAGRLGLMSARYFCNNLHAPWWRDRSKSGGQVVEQVIHMFDLLRYLAGEPESVYSRQENLFHREVENYTNEDVSATIVNFKNGGLGVVYATNNAIPGKWINDYRVVTGNITADFNDANHAVFHLTNQEPVKSQTIASDRDFRMEQTKDLIQAIRNNGVTRTPLREGARSLDLVLAAAQSSEQRCEIKLK